MIFILTVGIAEKGLHDYIDWESMGIEEDITDWRNKRLVVDNFIQEMVELDYSSFDLGS